MSQKVGFQVAAYDPTKPLIIDPTLEYSTYLGGSDLDAGFGIAVDFSGNAHVTGQAFSTDFPTTLGAFDRHVFVTKFNAAGSALVYSISPNSAGSGIAVDSSGNAYVSSGTFVTKLNPAGSLVYSIALGPASISGDIAVDAVGNAYVAATTQSADFPTTPGAFDTTFNGGQDAFVVKLTEALIVNSTGDAIDLDITDGVCDTGADIIRNSIQESECTLRAAIEQANENSGQDTITFNIPTTDPGFNSTDNAFTITPASPLPEIIDPVILDATSQPDGGKVVLDGTSAGANANGLEFVSGDNVVKGLVIKNFGGGRDSIGVCW